MAKKFNKGRQQKRNIDKVKLEKYREEIARELGVELPGAKNKFDTGSERVKKAAFTFEDKTPLF